MALAGTALAPVQGGARPEDERAPGSPPQRTGFAGVISPQRRHRKSAPLSEGLICQVRQRALTTPLPAKLREPLVSRGRLPWILGAVRARTVSLTIVGLLLQVVLSLAPDAATRRNIGCLILAGASPRQHHSLLGLCSTSVAHSFTLVIGQSRAVSDWTCVSGWWRCFGGEISRYAEYLLRGNIAPAYCALAAPKAWNSPPLNPIPRPLSLPLPRQAPCNTPLRSFSRHPRIRPVSSSPSPSPSPA